MKVCLKAGRPAAKTAAGRKKAPAKKKVAKKGKPPRRRAKKDPDKDSGKAVIVTSRGETKRVSTAFSAVDAFVDAPKGDEGDEYSDAFIDV